MTVVPADLQPIFDSISQGTQGVNSPGAGSVGSAPTASQPAAQAPDTSASDQTGALPLSPRGGGVSPGLSTQIAQNLNSFPVTSQPGSWAKSLMAASWDALAKRGAQNGGAGGAVQGVLGGVTNALAAAGSVGTAPLGSGALYGMGKAAEYLNEQKQQQAKTANELAQQKVANDRDAQRLALEKQNSQNETDRTATEKARAAQEIANGNVSAFHTAVLTRNATLEEQRAEETYAADQAKPFIEGEGATVLYRHLDSDALQEKLKNKELNGTKNLTWVDGHVGAIDASGKPIMDPETGAQKLRATFLVLSPPKDIVLSDANARLLNDYGVGTDGSVPWQAGTVVPAATGYNQIKQATQARAVLLQAEDKAAEVSDRKAQANERNEDAATKRAKLTAANTIAPYLSTNGNDPVLAFQAMSNSPTDKNKMNAFALAGYTPDVIEKMKKDGLAEADKTISDAPTKLAKLDASIQDLRDNMNKTADKNDKPIQLTDSQKQANADAVSSIENYQQQKQQISNISVAAATRKRNQYLGLAPNEDPRVVQSFMHLQTLAPEERANAILASPGVPDAAKRHMFILIHEPIPPQLQIKVAPRQTGQAPTGQTAQSQPAQAGQ